MLAPKSTHKRKRSSTRSDKARKLGRSRWIVNVIPCHSASHSSTRPAVSSPASASTCPNLNQRLDSLIHSHPFNRSLELILPLSSPNAVSEITTPLPTSVQFLIHKLQQLTSTHTSYRARIPLSLFLDPMFITAYIKTGSLIALTHQSDAPGFSAGLQDSACIDGQGTLVLSLCKDTYQTLGLTGSASHFSRLSSGRAADRTSGPDSRFIVELPLLSPSFVPGKKGYQKVLDRLRAWDQSRATALNTHQTIAQTHASSNITAAHGPVTSQHATWDMLFVWSPSRMHTDLVGAPTLSSSVNEIRFPDHLVSAQHVETIKLQPIQPIVTDSVWIPNLTQHPLAHPWRENERHFTELEPAIHLSSDSMATWCEYQDGLQQAIEWAGLASLGANSLRTFTRPDSTCVYTPPSPSSPGRTVKLSWSAPDNKSTLISPLLVSIIVNQVNGFIADSKRDSSPILENENVEWATLSCAGFPHAPLTWRAKVAFSSVYGGKDVTDKKVNSFLKKSVDQFMTDFSSSEEEEEEEEEQDSDDWIDIDEGFKSRNSREKKKKSKRNIEKNKSEHTFTPNTGESGWVSFCLPKHVKQNVQHSSTQVEADSSSVADQFGRWVVVELVGTDTRS